MNFFMKNNDNFSLDDYNEILENYNSKFKVLFNLNLVTNNQTNEF